MAEGDLVLHVGLLSVVDAVGVLSPRRDDSSGANPLVLEQILDSLLVGFSSQSDDDSVSGISLSDSSVEVRSVGRRHWKESRLMQLRVMLFRTVIDSTNELSAGAALRFVIFQKADAAESAVFGKDRSINSGEGPVGTVFGSMLSTSADSAGALPVSSLRFLMQNSILAMSTIRPEPSAMKQGMMRKSASVVAAGLVDQITTILEVSRLEADLANSEEFDLFLPVVDSSGDEFRADIQSVKIVSAEQTFAFLLISDVFICRFSFRLDPWWGRGRSGWTLRRWHRSVEHVDAGKRELRDLTSHVAHVGLWSPDANRRSWRHNGHRQDVCLLYTSPSPRDAHESRMPSSA